MSQIVFGEKCGFYQTYLSRIENGGANPTINAIEVIAKALGLSFFELLDLVKLRIEQASLR
ncbi:helix-turn-helix domain-containing protein [Polynucleobacter arcticus]|nr:helix-turn-helix transcriptional regulator [Polynucleobacter arcticus]